MLAQSLRCLRPSQVFTYYSVQTTLPFSVVLVLKLLRDAWCMWILLSARSYSRCIRLWQCVCKCHAVALAFRAQLVESVPTAAHDINVDILVTADETKACSQRGQQAMSGITRS